MAYRGTKNFEDLLLRIQNNLVFFDFSLTVKAAPHECEIRTGQP